MTTGNTAAIPAFTGASLPNKQPACTEPIDRVISARASPFPFQILCHASDHADEGGWRRSQDGSGEASRIT